MYSTVQYIRGRAHIAVSTEYIHRRYWKDVSCRVYADGASREARRGGEGVWVEMVVYATVYATLSSGVLEGQKTQGDWMALARVAAWRTGLRHGFGRWIAC